MIHCFDTIWINGVWADYACSTDKYSLLFLVSTAVRMWTFYLRQGGNVFAGFCLFVCLFVCLSVGQQDNSKSYGQIFLKFSGNVGNGKSYQWFNFGVIRQESWILDHCEIFVNIAFNGA